MARRLPTASSLTPFVPRVALRWEAEGGGLWREVDGSLVFVDISGFTALSEKLARRGRLGAEELTGTISACFGELLSVAYEAGGSLLKFGGDALLLLFDGDGHPTRACASALRMRDTMARVGRVNTSVGNVRLRMSVGVHSGPLHLFRVGESHHELIVSGPGASTTVEMEGTADAGEIVVSPSTAELIDARLVGAAKGPGYLLKRGRVTVGGLGAGPVEQVDDAAACVPLALREQLLSGATESEHRHVSIAFVHFDGVDGLLEQEGPASVARELDRLVRDAQAAAEHHGVTFLATDVDHDGGKVILVAGAPRAMGDDEGRMLGCLRQIADGRRRLPVRIGVNRGHVFVGEVGPSFRRTYTVMGDAVNLAARLMAKATSGQVLATAEVLDRSATEYATEPLEPFMVKGKSQPVHAFAVGEHGAHRNEVRSGRLPFVGRDAELTELRELLHRAAAGAGGLLDLSGVAGIGKSRLVEELAAEAGQFTIVRAFCEPYEAETPYYAFGYILRALTGVRSRAREGGAELRTAVASLAPMLLSWLPLVAAPAGVDVDPTPEVEAIEPRFRRARTRAVVGQLLAALVTEPTLMIVEDAEWLDALSAELVAGMAESAAARPWLVCVVRRDDLGGQGPVDVRAAATKVIHLGPLEDAAVQTLVSHATSASPLLPHQRDAVVARASGNPLFLEEMLRARVGASDDPLPESLEAVVAAQIDRLPPSERRLLRFTSVLGATFEASLLAAVTDGELRTASAATRRFPAFLEPLGGGLLRFRNECHRKVAYDALPFGRRRQLHAAVGAALEHAGAAEDAERAGTLSLHFMHAQEWDRCWRYARVGADLAKVKYANVEAAALYQRAIDAAAHLELPRADVAGVNEQLGEVALLAGEFARTRSAYRRARRLRAGDPISLAHLCAREYRAAMHEGQSDSAVRWVRRGLRLLEGRTADDGLSLRADLRYMLAHSYQQSGRPTRALDEAGQALKDAIRSGNRWAEASAYLLRDWALLALGRPDEAVDAPRALAISEEMGSAGRTGECLLYMGNFAYMRGRWNDALDLWTRAGEEYLRSGNTVDATFGSSNSAEILLCQGRYEEAEGRLRRVLETWQSMGYSGGVGDVLTSLGRIELSREHVDEAARLFKEAAELFASAHDARELSALGGLVECWLHDGQVERALEGVDDALRRQAISGDTTFAAMLHRVRAYALAALDRLDDAWAAIDESLAIARAGGAVYEVALTLEALSVVAELGGLPHDESADAERAALLEQLGIQTTPPPPLRVAA